MNIPLGKWSGSDATDALHTSIKEFNAQSSKQTQQMLRLTWVMSLLTVVMLFGLFVQIYLVFYPPAASSTPRSQAETKSGTANQSRLPVSGSAAASRSQ